MRRHYADRDRACILCQINKMEGIHGVDPGQNVEVAPTLTAVRTDTRPDWPDTPWENGDEDFEPGVTARWSLTPMNVIFTRTVANPKAGAKLTGKEGPHAVGFFLTQDRVNNLAMGRMPSCGCPRPTPSRPSTYGPPPNIPRRWWVP